MQTVQNMLSTGFSFHRDGFLDKAKLIYEQIISLDPQNFITLTLLGTLHLQQGRLNEAISFFEKSLTINPNQPDAWLNSGNVYLELNQHNLALNCYQKALEIKPDYAQVYLNCGNIYRQLGAGEQALSCYQKTIELLPNHPDAYNNSGLVLWEMKNLDDALIHVHKALSLSPNDPEIYNHLGHILSDMSRFAEAEKSYQASCRLHPLNPDPYIGLGWVFQETSQYEKALEYFDIALKHAPGNPEACFSKSTLLLLLGHLKEGWRLYESRWQTKDKKIPVIPHASPRLSLDGEVKGKKIVLQSEQGFGDIIQFSRYAIELKNRGAVITIGTRQPLINLLSSISPDISIISEDLIENTEADFHAPLMSLPGIMGTDTPDAIPSHTSYLSVDKTCLHHWGTRLGEKKKIRIGLVWSGSQTHKNDHRRSLPAELLKPLLETGHEFHCLQKEIRPLDAEYLSKTTEIHRHDAHIKDFSDTAALVSLMDLVISVDTSVVHLSGALGKPTWVLLPRTPDYRWLLNRTDSPWYPTLKLFRQNAGQDWQSVITHVLTELRAKYGE